MTSDPLFYVGQEDATGYGIAARNLVRTARRLGERKPVIVEAAGGPLEYLLPDDAYFVDCRPAPVRAPRHEARSYAPGQRWAEPDVAQAATLMRRVFDDPSAARAHGRRIGCHLRSRFSAPTIARRFLEILGS